MSYSKYVRSILIFVLLPIVFLVLLSGCSESAKSEAAIIEDLQAHVAFISPTAKISDCEIIKRQTDKDNKSDIVYLTVHAGNEQLTCTLSFVLQYELYNEGWLLESVNRTDEPWEFSGLKEDQLVSDITDYDFYFSDWDLDVQDIEIIDEGYNSDDGNLYEKWLTASLTAQNTRFDYFATYNVTYEIVDGNWELQRINHQSANYMPTYSPDISATDKVMETLEMDRKKITYDSYEYLRTDEDWENRRATRYYTAKKSWFYGTETFVVAIPLSFYLEDGDTQWGYSPDEITSTIQSVDWNIAGDWICNYDSPLFDFAAVRLRISDIVATNDPTVYNVTLYCDASSRNYRCFVDDGGPVELSYDGNYWSLKINEPGGLDSGVIWKGIFTLYGYKFQDRQGFYWPITILGARLDPV